MTNPRPKAGRPSDLDALIDVPKADGTMRQATVADRITELMATGAHVDTAAMSLGVDRSTLHTWLKIGGRTRKAWTANKLSHPDDPDGEAPLPEPHQTRCAEFSIAVDIAQAQWLQRQEATLETVSRPRKRSVITVRTDAQGAIVDRTERTEDDIPDMATVRWRLERHPASRDTYGNRSALEISGPDGEAIPVDLRVGGLADKIAALREQRDVAPPAPEETPHAE